MLFSALSETFRVHVVKNASGRISPLRKIFRACYTVRPLRRMCFLILNLWNRARWQILLHLQASKLEFWNPLTPVCMCISWAVYSSIKADFTQAASREAYLPQMIQFASKVPNRIFVSKICLSRAGGAFRQQACLTCVKSAFPDSWIVSRHSCLQERKDMFSL